MSPLGTLQKGVGRASATPAELPFSLRAPPNSPLPSWGCWTQPGPMGDGEVTGVGRGRGIQGRVEGAVGENGEGWPGGHSQAGPGVGQARAASQRGKQHSKECPGMGGRASASLPPAPWIHLGTLCCVAPPCHPLPLRSDRERVALVGSAVARLPGRLWVP